MDQNSGLVINLALASLMMTQQENDQVSGELSSEFSAMAEGMQKIAQLAEQPVNEQLVESIKNESGLALLQLQNAIIRFQYFDRLSQRLEHVRSSLDQLHLFANEHASPDEWEALLGRIQHSFSMREEHQVFEAISQGVDVETAVSQSKLDVTQTSDSDIELF